MAEANLRAAGSLDLAQAGRKTCPLVTETRAVGGSPSIERFVDSFNGEFEACPAFRQQIAEPVVELVNFANPLELERLDHDQDHNDQSSEPSGLR